MHTGVILALYMILVKGTAWLYRPVSILAENIGAERSLRYYYDAANVITDNIGPDRRAVKLESE